MNKRVLTGILAIILFFSGFIRAGAATSYHEGEVEEYIIEQLAAAHIPGVSLSIVTSQKEIYSAAFGDIKETSSDLRIGALTRTFTTLAIMQLVEKGDISLDDNVYKYVSDSSLSGISARTSIQDLLSYTRQSANPVLKSADAFTLYDTNTESGELSINSKFNLLGKVIEKVSGQSYASYIKENITVPLDMQSTYTSGGTSGIETITPGNKNYFGLPLKNKINNNQDYWLGEASNGLASDVKDMGKYMQMYLSAGGKIISYNSIETILGGSKPAGESIFGTDAYYSMGWTVTEKDGMEVYYCNGSVDDYTSAMFIIPSMDIGITMLFNSADALAGQQFTDIIEAGVVSLVMGGQAESVSSRDYFMKHMAADIIYFIAFVCALMPFLLMEVWIRWTREKFSVIRLSMDIILHIILPTSLIFIVRYCIAPWGIIKIVMPDLFFVSVVVIGLFYFGTLVKLIAYFIIQKHGGEYVEDEETDEEKEAEMKRQERKDKLRKRLDDIKEARQETSITAKALKEPETLEKPVQKQTQTPEKAVEKPVQNLEKKPVQGKEEKPVQKQAKKPAQKNTAGNTKNNKPASTEKRPERKDVPKNSSKRANNPKNRQEQIKKESKPKRFIVTNDTSAPKNGKESKNNKGNSANKTSSVNKPGSASKINNANKPGSASKTNNANKPGSTSKTSNVNKNASRKNNVNTSKSNQKNIRRNHSGAKTSGKDSLNPDKKQ
ncbi:MAG TPA: hypothetical protein DCZ23_03080 [Lachnospiraceae bacterium]|nr:hypothetical protein [Lachnospiraceae bacterium]